MIILDTCVLIFDALTPNQLSPKAKTTISKAEKNNQIFCSDISLWEIAMLVQKKRLDPGVDAKTFLQLIIQARDIQVLSIDIDIAVLSTAGEWNHFDPADRIIASTAIFYKAGLVTCDKKLRDIPGLAVIW